MHEMVVDSTTQHKLWYCVSMFHPDGPTFFELAQQALSGTTRGYDLLAEKFEYTPFRTPDELLGPMTEAAAREPIHRALDCCCGNGAIARALRPIVTDEIVGIDLSEGMLEAARRLGEDAPGEASLRFEQMNAFEMQLDAPFDLIATSGAFGHILEHQQDRFLDQVYANLVPGGRFMFVTAQMPRPTQPGWWLAHAFNAAMHVRNAIVDPPFIMFYLTFTLERALDKLLEHGFEVSVEAPYRATPLRAMRLVIARR